jgi:RNA polymerase sigma-70 factor, ECF subfamily
MQECSDLQLSRDFARLAAGDRSAVTVVFRALWPRLHNFCQRLLGNAHDADDAAQRALEKVFAQAAEFDQARSVTAWALTIALWECRTLRRQTARRRAEAMETEIAGLQPSPEEAFEGEELKGALEAAIVQLSESDQAILRSVLGSDDADARALGSTFRKQKQRALIRLKQAMKRLYDT